MRHRKIAYILIGLSLFAFLIIALCFNGTGDDGDSVAHFLYAQFAFSRPKNFLDLWAKPVYEALAAPFAQLGFTGIKVFNGIITTLALFFTYKTCEKLGIKRSWFSIVILFLTPLYLTNALSGLTEPLFACWLIASIYFLTERRYFIATLLLSFLPFIRSEGYILLGVVVVFLMIKGAWKYLPLLLVGHIFYTLVGYNTFHDWLWVFHRNPYGLSSAYGHGAWYFYLEHMPDIIGYALCVLISAGLIYGLIRLIRYWQKKTTFRSEELWLIYASFTALFIAESLTWTFGLFNSFGMLRVMNCVAPCAAIICLQGVNVLLAGISEQNYRAINLTLALIIISIVISFYFGGNYKRDLNLAPSQLAIKQLVTEFQNDFPDKKPVAYYDAASASLFLRDDYFNPMQHRILWEIANYQLPPTSSIVIWDDWYSPVESRVKLSLMKMNPNFILYDSAIVREPHYEQREAYLFINKNLTKNDSIYSSETRYDLYPGRPIKKDTANPLDPDLTCRLNDSNKYSPSLTDYLINLPFANYGKLLVTAHFYCADSTMKRPGKLVAEVSGADGKINYWEGYDVTGGRDSTGWYLFNQVVTLPKMKTDKDIFEIYFWKSPQSDPFYLKDFKIESVKAYTP